MLHLVAAFIFAQQSVTVRIGTKDAADSAKAARKEAKADSIAAVYAARRDSLRRTRTTRDSTRIANRRMQMRQVTPELLATAFKDERARKLLADARAARMQQDSSLQSYDAMSYERMSVGMGFRRIGRDRLLMRTERAARVVWQRGSPVYVETKGLRTAFPMLSGVGDGNADMGDAAPIPYFPGRESLWFGSSLAKANVEDMEMIHPLANGSEAYYTYTVGDSATFKLPGGPEIKLRELLVRAREPKWNVAVGSLWFDISSMQLVRAVYRMAEPMDIWAEAEEEAKLNQKKDPDDDVPRFVKMMMNPMKATISAITVESGLYEGRFWLPRIQQLDGDAQVSFMHIPFKMISSFQYAKVNGVTAPAFSVLAADTAQDSASYMHRRASRKNECKTGTERVHTSQRYQGALVVRTVTSCDSVALANSPDLPKSIYDEGEEIFGSSERDALIEQALGITAQPGFAPQKPVIGYGLYLTRYNRVEGFSTGIEATEALGDGYSLHALARMGHADLSPNAELSLSRSDLRHTYSVGAFKRLNASNDWGNPFRLGGFLSALLFGRDEGFYYRTAGVEVTGTPDSASGSWRLFAEQQWSTKVNTQFSLANAINGKRFGPNINADRINIAGASAVKNISLGLDPHGFRLLGDLKAEAAAGTMDYSRGAFDLTMSHGLSRRFDGALTLGAGTSGGTVPVQRLWYLGGTYTVRGQEPGAAVGNSFWLTRAELGSSHVGARSIVFGDLGWAGSRDKWSHPGRPLAGAGYGMSFMDGLFRFDIAKGIYPEKKIRTSFYVEARF